MQLKAALPFNAKKKKSGADVGRYAWPEHRGFCTDGHHRYALVDSV